MMDVTFLTRQLTDNAARIGALVRGVSPEEGRWKPDGDTWSILEVVNHLYDEEREDFRIRLDIILSRSDEPWPGIDPEGWVVERKYNQRDLEDSLKNFLTERETSLEWLRTLDDPDWDTLYQAHFGAIRAGDVFVSWVTHDHLHMRQLVGLHRDLTAHKAELFQLDYAGIW
jgi:hypothetical protein